MPNAHRSRTEPPMTARRRTDARGAPAKPRPNRIGRRRARELCNDARMILEHALLDTRPGMADEFLAAFAQARTIIASMPGFVSLRLERGIEQPDQFLLLVEWQHLEDHTVGFRGSAEYQQWRALLHHFYEPFPTVMHFERASSPDAHAGAR